MSNIGETWILYQRYLNPFLQSEVYIYTSFEGSNSKHSKTFSNMAMSDFIGSPFTYPYPFTAFKWNPGIHSFVEEVWWTLRFGSSACRAFPCKLRSNLSRWQGLWRNDMGKWLGTTGGGYTKESVVGVVIIRLVFVCLKMFVKRLLEGKWKDKFEICFLFAS